MEEVVSSNLTRSTKTFQTLGVFCASRYGPPGSKWSPKMDSTKKLLRVLGRAHKNTAEILQTSLIGGKPDKPDKSDLTR